MIRVEGLARRFGAVQAVDGVGFEAADFSTAGRTDFEAAFFAVFVDLAVPAFFIVLPRPGLEVIEITSDSVFSD